MIALGLGLGVPFAQPATSSGSTPATTLELLQAELASSAKSGIWLPTRLSSCWTDDGTTQATAGQALYRVDDLSGNSNHLYQTGTSTLRPVATEGMTYDDIDDHNGFAFSGGAGAAAMRLIFAIKTSDTSFVVISRGSGTTGSDVAIRAASGSSANCPLALGTLVADGVVIGSSITRIDCYDALSTGVWVIGVLRGADLTGYADFLFSHVSLTLGGAIGGAVLFNEADVADDAAAEALAVQLLQEELGL